MVGRSTRRARGTKTEENVLGDGNGNAETEQASNKDVPAKTSGERKEENGHNLRFVNKVSPSLESDTESMEEAENCF